MLRAVVYRAVASRAIAFRAVASRAVAFRAVTSRVVASRAVAFRAVYSRCSCKSLHFKIITVYMQLLISFTSLSFTSCLINNLKAKNNAR